MASESVDEFGPKVNLSLKTSIAFNYFAFLSLPDADNTNNTLRRRSRRASRPYGVTYNDYLVAATPPGPRAPKLGTASQFS
jgi:hypothetical protein